MIDYLHWCASQYAQGKHVHLQNTQQASRSLPLRRAPVVRSIRLPWCHTLDYSPGVPTGPFAHHRQGHCWEREFGRCSVVKINLKTTVQVTPGSGAGVAARKVIARVVVAAAVVHMINLRTVPGVKEVVPTSVAAEGTHSAHESISARRRPPRNRPSRRPSAVITLLLSRPRTHTHACLHTGIIHQLSCKCLCFSDIANRQPREDEQSVHRHNSGPQGPLLRLRQQRGSHLQVLHRAATWHFYFHWPDRKSL